MLHIPYKGDTPGIDSVESAGIRDCGKPILKLQLDVEELSGFTLACPEVAVVEDEYGHSSLYKA